VRNVYRSTTITWRIHEPVRNDHSSNNDDAILAQDDATLRGHFENMTTAGPETSDCHKAVQSCATGDRECSPLRKRRCDGKNNNQKTRQVVVVGVGVVLTRVKDSAVGADSALERNEWL
jgi:hypothetical protein